MGRVIKMRKSNFIFLLFFFVSSFTYASGVNFSLSLNPRDVGYFQLPANFDDELVCVSELLGTDISQKNRVQEVLKIFSAGEIPRLQASHTIFRVKPKQAISFKNDSNDHYMKVACAQENYQYSAQPIKLFDGEIFITPPGAATKITFWRSAGNYKYCYHYNEQYPQDYAYQLYYDYKDYYSRPQNTGNGIVDINNKGIFQKYSFSDTKGPGSGVILFSLNLINLDPIWHFTYCSSNDIGN